MTFTRLLPLAAAQNLRIIAFNRRDYPGSSPFADEDLHMISEPYSNDDQGGFIRARGLEITELLAWIIREKNIPAVRDIGDGAQTGGLILLGWSLGVSIALMFAANLNTYPSDLVSVIEPYLRTLVLYGTL